MSEGDIVPDSGPTEHSLAYDVLERVEKVARLFEYRPAGGTTWRVTLEANGERAAVVERDARGLRIVFIRDGLDA